MPIVRWFSKAVAPEEAIIAKAFAGCLTNLFVTFFSERAGEDAPTGADKRFRKGLLILREAREQALAVVREQV